METKLTPEILQSTLYNLDVSTQERRENIEKLVSHLEKSSISFASKLTPRKEKVKRKITHSTFLNKLTQNRNFERKIEYEVVKREGSQIPFHSDSVFPQLTAKPEITMGPFLTDFGYEVYFDFIKYEEISRIRMLNSDEPIFYISAKIRRILIGQTSISEIKLPKGDIWINAKNLTTGTPASTFMGLKVKSGTIKLGLAVTSQNGEIILNPLNNLSLDLELDNDFELGNDNEYGVDAKEILLNLPSHMNFNLRRGKLYLNPLDSIQSRIYGDSKEFQVDTNFTYHVKDQLLYLPLQPDQPNFQIRDLKSKFWEWEGETQLKSAHWFFNTKVITANYTTPIQINGFLSYELEEGLNGRWHGLEKKTPFSKCLLL